jgi:hypothetical protein
MPHRLVRTREDALKKTIKLSVMAAVLAGSMAVPTVPAVAEGSNTDENGNGRIDFCEMRVTRWDLVLAQWLTC